jgi:hypothetical protein
MGETPMPRWKADDMIELMLPDKEVFERSVRRQIELNRARTPTERFLAMCDLLEAIRAMEPKGPEAEARRGRLQAQRQRERERMREYFRRLAQAERDNASKGV